MRVSTILGTVSLASCLALAGCRKQLEWAEDPEAVRMITETMLRELESCRRLCERLHRRAAPRPAV